MGDTTQQQQVAPPAQPAVPMQQNAAFSPGQQGLLAQQMQAGFGGSLLDQMNSLAFYRDMQTPVINTPADLAGFAPPASPVSSLALDPRFNMGNGPMQEREEPLTGR